MKVGPYDLIERTPTTKGGTSTKRIKQVRAARRVAKENLYLANLRPPGYGGSLLHG